MSIVQPVNALNLDSSQQQSFIRYYRTLPEKPPTTIRFFDRVEYYTVHGEDAKYAAQEVFKTSAAIKLMGIDNLTLEYVVLSRSHFEKFARTLLLVKQYQAEVYVNQGSNKNNDWMLEYKGSPGNLSQFEEILFENADIVLNSCIMAVKLGRNNLLGVSCVDANERTFEVCQFTDNEFFSQLESLIIQMSPKECLLKLSSVSDELSRLTTILQRSNILCTMQKQMKYDQESIVQDLNRLLRFEQGQKQSSLALQEINLTNAMASLHAAINYLELPSDKMNFGQFKMKILDTKKYVHLDSAAVKALNILPRPGAGAFEIKTTSILGLLDCCRTPQGRRLLAQWIKQPLRDINAVNNRLDVVDAFVNHTKLRLTLHGNYLRGVPDLLMLSKKILKKKAQVQDLYKIYQSISKLPHMVSALRSAENKTVNSMFIDHLSDFLTDMEKYQQMIETTLDMDLVDRGEYLVKPSFDDELQELHEKKEKLEEKIQKQMTQAARTLGFEAGKNIKLEYTEQLGYFLRVTLKEEPVLRKNKKFKIVGAVKGGVRFTNDELEKLNEDYMNTKNIYEQEQKNVVQEILSISAGYCDTLCSISFLVAQIDVLVSFAMVTCAAPKQYIRPKMLPEGSGYMKLIQVRHPCLEIQDHVSYNPNDVEFKQNVNTFHIVTGPNMGGKSTYIRSIGVTALMAQIGCFVPCDEAEISLVDSILARVGAEDCLEKGLSTFMLEMVETAGILRTATENSLIIIDELGRGTSTYEGAGIAWSIAEHLAKDVKAFSLFATHFHEITRLADEVNTVVNKHVTALIANNQLTLMYQVKPGICDQSFGVQVAEMAGFPRKFIRDAINLQHSLEDYRHAKDLQQCNAETTKQILQEGDKLIEMALIKLKSIDHKSKGDEELKEIIKKMKTEIKSTTNPYIQALLES